MPQTWPRKTGGVCTIGDNDKRDCGAPGISNEECARRGCCLAGMEAEASERGLRASNLLSCCLCSQNGVPTCYYATDADQDLCAQCPAMCTFVIELLFADIFGHGRDYKARDLVYFKCQTSVPSRLR